MAAVRDRGVDRAAGERGPVDATVPLFRDVGFDADHRPTLTAASVRPLIGLDDPADERMADDVAGAEADHRDLLDALELGDRVGEAGL